MVEAVLFSDPNFWNYPEVWNEGIFKTMEHTYICVSVLHVTLPALGSCTLSLLLSKCGVSLSWQGESCTENG